MIGATFPLGARAAITRPIAISDAPPSRNTSTKPAGLRGRPGPAAISSAVDTMATTRLISSWTASIRRGETGVVDILRSTPCSL